MYQSHLELALVYQSHLELAFMYQSHLELSSMNQMLSYLLYEEKKESATSLSLAKKISRD